MTYNVSGGMLSLTNLFFLYFICYFEHCYLSKPFHEHAARGNYAAALLTYAANFGT